MAKAYCSGLKDCFVKDFRIKSQGIDLKAKWITPFGFTQNTDVSMLVLPEYLVLTTQPNLRQQIAAIQELQFRQDELKQDFGHAILSLATHMRYSP